MKTDHMDRNISDAASAQSRPPQKLRRRHSCTATREHRAWVASSLLLAAIFLTFAPVAHAISPTQNAQNPWWVVGCDGIYCGGGYYVSSPAELISLVEGTPGVNGFGVHGIYSFNSLDAYTCNTADGLIPKAQECVYVAMVLIDSTGQIADLGTPGEQLYILVNVGQSVGQVCPSGAYVAPGVSCPSTTQPGKLVGNQKNSPTGCNCQAGDPIDVASGNVFYQETDYETPGANKLRFARSYNSRVVAPPFAVSQDPPPADNSPAVAPTFAVSLGYAWRTNYDRYLDIVTPTQVVAERDDGQQVTFTLTGSTWTTDSDIDLTLTQSGAMWMLADHSDNIEAYTAASSSEAILSSITARNGYTQTLSYTSQQLTSVTDSYGRQLLLTYSGPLLNTVTTPDGLVLTYRFGSSGTTPGLPDRLASVSYSTTPTTSRQYLYITNLPFALTGVIDEDGNLFSAWSYDPVGRGLLNQRGSIANLITVSYNDSDGSRTVSNALGVTDTYAFTTLQGVSKVAQIARAATATTAGTTRTFTYDSNGYVASQTDWNGVLTSYVNDVHGQPTTINEAVGTPQARATTITYFSNFHVPSQIVTPGLTTNFTYDSSGELLTKALTDTTTTSVPFSTNGQTRNWTYTWSNFLPASVKGPRTDVSELTSFTYDGTGALTKITNALGQAIQVTQHTPGGLPQTVVDANGVTSTLAYDARSRLLTSTLSTGAGALVTNYTYDPTGNLLTETLPDGSALTNTYDPAHRLIATADLFADSITYTLDAQGDQANMTVSGPQGTVMRQHSATFDALGRILDDVGGVGQTTVFSYDPNGNPLTITDPLQRVTQRSSDALNRVIQVTDPASGNTALSYDPHDRPVSVTDPIGNTTAYTYDGFGDVIQEVSPARGTTVYRYDLDGNLVQKVDARGAVANFTYDAINRVTATTYPADASENVAYTYDQAAGGFGVGRLTSLSDAAGTLSRTYDERGNVLTESRVPVSSVVTLLTKYAYDGANRVVSITYPSGTGVSYTRDAMGRVTAVAATAPGATTATPVLSAISYQPFGPPNAMTYGNGVAESRTFDLDYRLTSLTGTSTDPIQNLSYGYDAADNVLSVTNAVTPGYSQTFGYDALNRLINASGGYGPLAYTYDANGNRLTENPAAPITLDGLGSITSLTYNQAGRLASTYAGSQQLTQYTYDAFGRRLAKVGSLTAMSFFQYDLAGNALEETDNLGNVKADYLYLDGRPVAEFNAGQLYFMHNDRLGTPQLGSDMTQAVDWVGNYQPFGALSASSLTSALGQDLRLPGQENDLETGLYHNGFRDYAPGLGRYLQSDPTGLRGGINAFSYVGANPATLTDRTGLDEEIPYQSQNEGGEGGVYSGSNSTGEDNAAVGHFIDIYVAFVSSAVGRAPGLTGKLLGAGCGAFHTTMSHLVTGQPLSTNDVVSLILGFGIENPYAAFGVGVMSSFPFSPNVTGNGDDMRDQVVEVITRKEQ